MVLPAVHVFAALLAESPTAFLPILNTSIKVGKKRARPNN
jgi:hypothetical protein